MRTFAALFIGIAIGAVTMAVSDEHMYAVKKWAFVGEKPPASGLCSDDFYHWWPARDGTMCYASDKP